MSNGPQLGRTGRSRFGLRNWSANRWSGAVIGLLALGVAPTAVLAGDWGRPDRPDDNQPIVLKTQGSFMPGGTVVTNPGTFDPIALTPDGQTIHGDHAYAAYQIPVNARRYPLVMWHGGGQFTKTWESTPDGRDGYQNIFLRQRYSTYLIDEPHRGNAGRATTNGTITAVPGPGPTGEQGIFIRFRAGIWPNYFPNAQFPRGSEALNQWWRQQTPDTAARQDRRPRDQRGGDDVRRDRASGAAHSPHSFAGGVYGWEDGDEEQQCRRSLRL